MAVLTWQDNQSAIADAIEANLAGQFAYLVERAPGSQVLATDDLVVVNSNLPSDTFNCVAGTRLAKDVADRRIPETIHYFRSRGLPFAWWVWPRSRPEDIGRRLIEAGLVLVEQDEGMAMDLSRLADDQRPKEFQIRQVQSGDDLAAFARIIASLFDPPDVAVETFYSQVRLDDISGGAPMRLYLGFAGDVPVATSVSYRGGGVVGVYSVATLPGWRGRGFGTAMTVAPLLDARQQGVQVAVLQASGDGLRIYQRIGFRSFGTFDIYQ